MKTYAINSAFISLQGEGDHAGRPATFLRFAGCNVNCPWCDTDHSKQSEMTANQIVSYLNTIGDEDRDFLVLTGGEPGLQVDSDLLGKLRKGYRCIAIETNGTCKLPGGLDWITVSPKPHVFLRCIEVRHADEVKVVLADREKPLEGLRGRIRAPHWFVSPRFDGQVVNRANMEWCVNFVLANPGWRLTSQFHKYWGIR